MVVNIDYYITIIYIIFFLSILFPKKVVNRYLCKGVRKLTINFKKIFIITVEIIFYIIYFIYVNRYVLSYVFFIYKYCSFTLRL